MIVRRLAIVLAGALLAACGTAPAVPDPTGSSGTPRVQAPSTPVSSVPVVDPEHAVEQPGPRTERLWPADMLVFSQESLSPAMVEAIRGLKGISKVEPLSLAQASIENAAYTVAAVNPASYRLFTPQGSADTLEVWQRVAGGEIAATTSVGKRLADKNGFIKLGAGADAPLLHLGAYAPQIPRVDLVVNTKWGESLGMVQGNAVLITTGITSPQSVRPKIEKIVGSKASVQILGPDLDISVQQTAVLAGGSVASVIGTFNYRVIGGGRIAPEASWVASHISTRTMPILGAMTCNNAIFPQLEAALKEIQARGLADKIHPDEYAGCYYPRFIANTTTLSNHSFGTAFDINVPGNQRGTVGEIDRTVVSIFQKWGFTWGGDWSYTDPMHFELNQVVTPG